MSGVEPRPSPRKSGALHKCLNQADLRRLARRRLPRGMFEFIDRGTEDEVAVRNNAEALERLQLVPRVLVDVSQRSLGASLFGTAVPLPVGVAPTGAAGLVWHDGEVAIARAARDAGLPFTLSTVSLSSIEDVAERAGGRLWFQLYLSADPAISDGMIDRSRACGYEALMLTVDTVGSPNREFNNRNGFTVPFGFSVRSSVDAALRPRWLAAVFLRHLLTRGTPRFANFPTQVSVRSSQAGRTMAKRQTASWEDLRTLRRKWAGPLIVKGILDPDDARMAADAGADAIVVSNHGARNLDATPAPIEVLAGIADAVGHRLTVMVDGAMTRGSGVVKALALGAKFVLLGRAPLYGAAAGGEAGARLSLEIVREEVDRVLTFLGCPDIHALGPAHIRHAGHISMRSAP